VNGGVWESALELACFYGWRPAGTETPTTNAWCGRKTSTAAAGWNSRDYFSHESQHVERSDARALAEAIARALRKITAQARDDGDSDDGAELQHAIPSRASAVADGISPHRRKAMNRFAEFAGRGGFTIGNSI
jgi:hypothetical protein